MQTPPLSHLRVLVGVSDIARLNDVAPAVVTNWRGRFESFPRPAVTGARPQFDLAKVLAWLDSGEGPRGRRVPDITPEMWWQWGVRAFLLKAPVPAPREALAALLLLHHRADGRHMEVFSATERQRDSQLLVGAFEHLALMVEKRDPQLRGVLLPVFGRLEPDGALCLADMLKVLRLDGWRSSALDQLDVVLADVDAPAGPARTTANTLARLMASLAQVRRGETVFDPACGEGAALLACAQQADGEASLYGQELDEGTWHIARARLLLAGLDTSGLAKPGLDSLRQDQHAQLQADVVILDPPVNEPKAPLARWFPHALRHLQPKGRAVIALPLSSVVEVAAARRAPDKEVVAQLHELHDSGLIHGAVVLPRGHRADVVGPLALFIIGGTENRRRADDRVAVATIDTRQRIGADAVIDEVASVVSHSGLASLAGVGMPAVSVEFVGRYRELEAQLDYAGAVVELSVTSGRRPSPKNVMERADATSIERAVASVMEHPDAMSDEKSSNALSFDVSSVAPMLRSSKPRDLWGSSRLPGDDDVEQRLRRLQKDVRVLLRRLEKMRPLLGEGVYERIAEDIERVRKSMSDE